MDKIAKNVVETNIVEAVEERFGSFSKYVILQRAIPDARDGLKPVQRRILYAMYMLGLTYDKPYKKSARSVGEIIGKYHPHGDSSVYEAMIYFSQTWKNNIPFIEVHGNNGSIDGDGPAAMRYTEARLSKLSSIILENIHKNSVDFIPNFDDSEKEPTVLPSFLPTLLLNGTRGIATGYATNIPPFNILELLEGITQYLKKKRKMKYEEIIEIVKGPDFPTGATLFLSNEQLINLYKTGREKLVVRGDWIFDEKKNRIIITSIPYDISKEVLVCKMDEIRIDAKIPGIKDVRDESGIGDEIKIIIDLEKNVNHLGVINYFYKNTPLQDSIPANCVAIYNQKPVTMSLFNCFDAYIDHSLITIKRIAEFDFAKAIKRKEIVEGLIKAQSIIDELIKVIRASKDKKDAEKNIILKWNFTELQAEAIVLMRLHSLTNTDVFALQNELNELNKKIETLDKLINQEEERIKHLLKIIKNFQEVFKDQVRKTKIINETLNTKQLNEEVESEIAQEVELNISQDGWIYNRLQNSNEIVQKMRGDVLIGHFKTTSNNKLFLITNLGNIVPVSINKLKATVNGNPAANINEFFHTLPKEQVVYSFVSSIQEEDIIYTATKNGMIKSTMFSDIKNIQRTTTLMKLKDKDLISNVFILNKEAIKTTDLISLSKNLILLTYPIDEISPTGLKGQGIKSHSLKIDDEIMTVSFNIDKTNKLIISSSKTKFSKLNKKDFPLGKRAQVGTKIKK
ncbi:MAG: DNA topoisomerase (ATP-hydrolyzing) [Mycoplasma sp.]